MTRLLLTAYAIVKSQDGLYAVMCADKFKLHSLPGGGLEDGEEGLIEVTGKGCLWPVNVE